MDYESIRQKNIARNEKMIAELFGIFPARVDSSQHSEENTHSRYEFMLLQSLCTLTHSLIN